MWTKTSCRIENVSPIRTDNLLPTDQLFSDKTINIHYKTPASRLLKMNTLNEFELNRLKKFYAEELAQRLQRTRSSSKVSDRDQAARGHHHLVSGRRCSSSGGSNTSSPCGQPVEPLAPMLRSFRSPVSPDEYHFQDASHQPAVDLKRYQHALASKQARGGSQAAGGPPGRWWAAGAQSGAGGTFARVLHDFQARSGAQISLRRGDLVEVLGLLEAQAAEVGGCPSATGARWANVEDCQSGLQGLVPLSHLDHSVGCAVAKRDVQCCLGGPPGFRATPPASRTSSRASDQQQQQQGQGHHEQHQVEHLPLLPMSKGEPIVLLRRLSGQLYEASNTRQKLGLVWSNDVEIIRQPQRQSTAAPDRHYESCTIGRPPNEQDQPKWRPLDQFTQADQQQQHRQHHSSRWAPDFFGGRAPASRRAGHPHSGQSEHRVRQFGSPGGPHNGPPTSLGHHYENNLTRPPDSHPEHTNTMHHCSVCPEPPDQFQQTHHFQQNSSSAPRRSSSSPMIGVPRDQLEFGCQHLDEGQRSATMGRERETGKQVAGHQEHQHEQLDGALTRRLPRMCRARFAYKPRQKDELELVVGDILVVVHECDDGWLIGSSYGTRQMGTFPGNFVEFI